MSKEQFPTNLKPILPYIQRANELESKAPLVAFYCRTYAVQEGINFTKNDKSSETYLLNLMDRLEKDKKTLNPNPEEGRATVEIFALKMFKKADDADRAGNHSQTTAKLFYVSSILMACTKQFGELSEDIVEKLKYAKWKAAEISKALKTGEKVQSGAFGEEEQKEEENQKEENEFKPLQPQDPFSMNPLKQPQKQTQQIVTEIDPFQQIDPFKQININQTIDPFETKTQNQKVSQFFNDVDPFETKKPEKLPPTAPKIEKQEQKKPEPKQEQKKVEPKQEKVELKKVEEKKQVSYEETHSIPKDVSVENIIKAQQMAKYVISALQFPDVPTAVKYLEEALKLLKNQK